MRRSWNGIGSSIAEGDPGLRDLIGFAEQPPER